MSRLKNRPARLLALLLALLTLCACAPQADTQPSDTQPSPSAEQDVTWDTLEFDHSMELLYAEQFSVDYYQGGYKKITIAGTDQFLVVPEGAQIPSGLPAQVAVLQQPLDRIYLVATATMDLFRELDAIDHIRLSGLDADGWYIEEAKQALQDGRILYAGKYSAPDYERILEEGCDLSVQSTMIYHTPEVKEQLERFGIPVLVERSSYESHPLARMEWIKLFAALLNKEEAADTYFNEQMETLVPILEQENTGKTVAFFYVTSAGAVSVRKSGDYIAKAIGLAGGVYVPRDLSSEENALSTMTIQMESFYAGARDADVLIYNSSIDAELQTIDDLLAKSDLFKNFKAVQDGNVWCTGKNLYQESLGVGDLMEDLNAILTADDLDSLELTYLHRLT
ncbi:MAG: ABC transporter substrate-binding protein [Oscillospiraceae bacterium]